jgi:methylase of polypeptide subunit release factors
LHSSLLKRNGDIRYRKGKELDRISDFLERTQLNLNKIIEDLKAFTNIDLNCLHKFTSNAKNFDCEIENKIDVVLTSPPYLNGTNYIRNTKLELWFLRYLKTKKDLSLYRRLVVTAGINDVDSEKKIISLPSIEHLISDPKIWYDKRIPKMVNDYFFDMKIVLENSYKYLKKGGYIFIDIGDSIYGGIHIPTDEILIELCISIGFKFKDNIKLRERKSKDGSIVKQTLIIAEKI